MSFCSWHFFNCKKKFSGEFVPDLRSPSLALSAERQGVKSGAFPQSVAEDEKAAVEVSGKSRGFGRRGWVRTGGSVGDDKDSGAVEEWEEKDNWFLSLSLPTTLYISVSLLSYLYLFPPPFFSPERKIKQTDIFRCHTQWLLKCPRSKRWWDFLDLPRVTIQEYY